MDISPNATTKAIPSFFPLIFFLTLVFLSNFSVSAQENKIYLDDLNLQLVKQGWGQCPKKNLSCVGNPIKMLDKVYNRGVGTHANASFYIKLNGSVSKFESIVGIDDETEGNGSIIVRFFGDNKLLYTTQTIKGREKPEKISLNLQGISNFIISAIDAHDDINFDHVDLAEAYFIASDTSQGTPEIVPRPEESTYTLTPPVPSSPRINSPRITGVRPGSPFLFRIPCTGERPISFQIDGLPEGLNVSPEGIISGTIKSHEAKTYSLLIKATNKHGENQNTLKIVVGDTLALTPPMGWNHWYTYYDRITAEIVQQAADIMVSSGMADVGYQYVNIDDCWANAEECSDPTRIGPARGNNGNILPNKHFPDMKALTDYIHSRGLRAGIYSSPGPKTCAGFTGSYQYEEQDARQFAEWGFDFLKYDWCSYSNILPPDNIENLTKPYKLMGSLLKTLNRDIVFNLCQYGMGEVWKWGKEVGGNSWRTAGDLGFELLRYHEVALRNAELWKYAGPGAWNDPDYLLLGYSGEANVMGKPRPCPLTPSEQYSYMSLWCLMASPLFFSGDMTRLDEFTLNILCNPEVIEINQDPLGTQGHLILSDKEKNTEIWLKPLQNGSFVICLFNLEEIEQELSVQWKEIGLRDNQNVRDLWRQKDLGSYPTNFTIAVPRHGAALIKVTPL